LETYCLRSSHPKLRQDRRSARGAPVQVHIERKRQDREGPRPDDPTVAAAESRRSHRV